TPPRSRRTAPGCAARGRRSLLRRPLGEVTEQEVGVERRQIEAPRRLVDELHPVHAGIVMELIVDPPHGLLDGRFPCSHARAPSFEARPPRARDPGPLYSGARRPE